VTKGTTSTFKAAHADSTIVLNDEDSFIKTSKHSFISDVEVRKPFEKNQQPNSSQDCHSPRITLQRLDCTRNEGWLSHLDIERIFDLVLPTDCTYIQLPNHDLTFNWSDWSSRRFQPSLGASRTFSVIHNTIRKHWVLLEFSKTGYFVREYDSIYKTDDSLAILITHITWRLKWERHHHIRMRTPQQSDGHSCGIHVLVCALHRAIRMDVPKSIDARIWRFALRVLLANNLGAQSPMWSAPFVQAVDFQD
jgi:hypothetical protein